MINVMGARRLMKVSFNKKVRELRGKVNKQVIEMAKIGNNRTTLSLDTYKYTLDMANVVIAKFKDKGFTSRLDEDLLDDALTAYYKYVLNHDLYVRNSNICSWSDKNNKLMDFQEFEVWYNKRTDRPKKYVIHIEW